MCARMMPRNPPSSSQHSAHTEMKVQRRVSESGFELPRRTKPDSGANKDVRLGTNRQGFDYEVKFGSTSITSILSTPCPVPAWDGTMPRLFTRAGLSMIGRFVVFGLVVAAVYTLVLRRRDIDRSPDEQHDHHRQRGLGDPEVRNVPCDEASEDASAIRRRGHATRAIPCLPSSPARAVRSSPPRAGSDAAVVPAVVSAVS